MFVHPQIDPVALSLGPLSIHWYGLMYLLGFALFIVLGRYRIKRGPQTAFTYDMLDDALFYGVLGVILGGRLGHIIFYQLGYYLQHPLQIFAIWEGGMSFHGGMIGVFVAMALFARKYRLQWLVVTDFIAPLVPLGLGAGRIGNFINAELWGRPTDVSWGMVFPYVDALPRHPSQLYQFALEGLAFFILLWLYSAKPRPVGAVSGMFLIGYGLFRTIAEFYREPENGFMGVLTWGMSMGQWLSLPMVLVGAGMLVWANGKISNQRINKTAGKKRKT
ncbi:Prolipoprotein diacylglyceryl transferase [Nitrosomonas cryotolerans]|uniref:Phosphatidylglycerol--prolipoprotein diacylglyceryl transferase n=1 Tax=Nitrosomonas cryotolerans ATCC 49181 TaxID=1131553 RepID=A0A1N6J108_9PROT|nr:prolipoprotein diacylglyceryl transferase [Nitrosomonas cryotolerans]SFP53718.1 Prolipoprotein diacylglyceryl transferase [Nitrosomonas cryotolerans]SIO38068.1 Prolipoprotein diacylglyceryl transferase [Nitrosomonas cryotolerans ATCC 49181]